MDVKTLDVNELSAELGEGWTASVIRKYDDALTREGFAHLAAIRGAANRRIFGRHHLELFPKMREVMSQYGVTVQQAGVMVAQLMERGEWSPRGMGVSAAPGEALVPLHTDPTPALQVLGEIHSEVSGLTQQVALLAQNQQHFEGQHEEIYRTQVELIAKVDALTKELEAYKRDAQSRPRTLWEFIVGKGA